MKSIVIALLTGVTLSLVMIIDRTNNEISDGVQILTTEDCGPDDLSTMQFYLEQHLRLWTWEEVQPLFYPEEIRVDAIEVIEPEEEVILEFDTRYYLPDGFDPFKDVHTH